MSNVSIKKAAFINFVSRYSNIIIQLLINAVLARLLTPSDYGIVAIISVFISFFSILSDMGFGPAIIQNKELDERDISNIFLFTILVAFVSSIAFILFSYPISMFYNNDVYIGLGRILAIGIFFNVLNIVPNALLIKAKEFKKLGIRTVVVTILGGIFTIILALNGAKYYALVWNTVFMGLATFVWNYITIRFKIIFNYKSDSVKKIRSFSAFQFGFNFINYFARNSDNLLIGKFLGQVPLGYYDKAYKLMLYPVSNLTNVITPVLHPILSEYQHDREKIYHQFIKVIRILSLLGIFFSIFCYFSAKEIILIMFGSQWLASIPVFKILSLSIWSQMTTSSASAIFQATNETKQLFRTGIQSTICIVSFITIGLFFGNIKTVAIFVTLAYIFNFFIAYRMLIKVVLNKSLLKFLLELKKHSIIAIIMIVGMALIHFDIKNTLISIIVKLIIASCLYGIGLIVTKEFKVIKGLIKR
ncbi:lipopolysaccharide biosynthesis protein [Gottfriedia luciferensis]|uniref:lipopolysaccharide biosynthesis protein n=1 Tax=Gottfriedia luciferensis TaxID=178774 RepID=UPI001ABF965F|nr:lipopolysaccharide biosynthesis protein [Gottfriedia luciferensis]